MNLSSSLARVATKEFAQEQTAEQCPACQKTTSFAWLQAPDWLHGRKQRYTLRRCPGCSLVWLSHPPDPEEMHLHYTDEYHRMISAAGNTAPWRWKDRKTTLSLYKQSGAILDLGCSSGSFLESLRDQPWELHGVELSEDVARDARERTNADVFAGDILSAPFAPESFDVITCFDVFEHVYEPRKIIARVAEWLKPGGIFYVLVPNIDSAEARVFRSYWSGLELPRHLFHYSPESLSFLATSVGLEQVSLETRRNPAVGNSVRYYIDDRLGRSGLRRTPLAYLDPPGIVWKVVRKVMRRTVLRGLLALAPLAGGGESIHGVFRKAKPESSRPK